MKKILEKICSNLIQLIWICSTTVLNWGAQPQTHRRNDWLTPSFRYRLSSLLKWLYGTHSDIMQGSLTRIRLKGYDCISLMFHRPPRAYICRFWKWVNLKMRPRTLRFWCYLEYYYYYSPDPSVAAHPNCCDLMPGCADCILNPSRSWHLSCKSLAATMAAAIVADPPIDLDSTLNWVDSWMWWIRAVSRDTSDGDRLAYDGRCRHHRGCPHEILAPDRGTALAAAAAVEWADYSSIDYHWKFFSDLMILDWSLIDY